MIDQLIDSHQLVNQTLLEALLNDNVKANYYVLIHYLRIYMVLLVQQSSIHLSIFLVYVIKLLDYVLYTLIILDTTRKNTINTIQIHKYIKIV